MTNKLEEALWDDYRAFSEIIAYIDGEGGSKKIPLEERDKVRQQLLKLELGKYEYNIKEKEIQAENQRRDIDNRITIATFTVSTLISLYALSRTFNFDQESTITSTLGRNILNGFVPRRFRK